jgi:hypothetical protein
LTQFSAENLGMEYITLGVSVVAIVFTALNSITSRQSLRNSQRALRVSQDAHRHTQIVTFEQRKQDVQQNLFDCHLLFGEVKDLLNRFREEVIQNNIEPLADKSDVFDLARQDYLDLIKRLDGLARPLPRTRI